MLSISDDFPQLAKKLDQLSEDVATKAQASGLNKTVDQSKTQMVREISTEYAVSASYVRDRLRVRRATFRQGRFSMSVELDGTQKKRSANVIAFTARQTKRGLTVKIKRTEGRKLIPGAFIANKGRTVFKRVGKDRLPIKPVQTIDIAQMFNARRIKDKVLQVIVDRLPTIMDREINFYVQRFNGGR